VGKGASAFRESDVRRVLRAITKEGLTVAGFRFDRDGGLTVLIGKPGEPVVEANYWDKVLKTDEQN
jgi:hypothetical protein